MAKRSDVLREAMANDRLAFRTIYGKGKGRKYAAPTTRKPKR